MAVQLPKPEQAPQKSDDSSPTGGENGHPVSTVTGGGAAPAAAAAAVVHPGGDADEAAQKVLDQLAKLFGDQHGEMSDAVRDQVKKQLALKIAQQAGAAQPVPSKQAVLRKLCFHHKPPSYWHFEICFGGQIRQYHSEEQQGKDGKTTTKVMAEYRLGHRTYNRRIRTAASLEDAKRVTSGRVIDPRPSLGEEIVGDASTKVFRSLDTLYASIRTPSADTMLRYLHVYTGGTTCTGSGGADDVPRSAVVAFYCPKSQLVEQNVPESTAANTATPTVSVEETSSCLYNITVESQYFCDQ